MKITNKYNLPISIVEAVSWDLKPREGYSVTDLINPPRITQLSRRHWDEIEQDVTERIWVLLGQAIHYVLEKGKLPDSLKEETLKASIDGVKVTGRPDFWYQQILDDYKITSVWSVVYEPEGRREWHAQLNLYKWLCKQNGIDCDVLEVCAILRDWQKSKSFEEDYPSIPVAIFNIPVWPDKKIETYLRGRISLHLQAERLPDNKLPSCTPEEMWSKPTTYAIMKPNRKKAIRVCSTRQEAEQKMFEGEYIVQRPGSNNRCKGYCDVKPFCNQNDH